MTQVEFPKSRIDLLLTLDGWYRLAVEIKLRAPEGKGQLMKYLNLSELHSIAFVTADTDYDLSNEVLNHPKYQRPRGRDQFIWYDFADLFKAGANSETGSFAIGGLWELFEKLNLRPAPVASDEITSFFEAAWKSIAGEVTIFLLNFGFGHKDRIPNNHVEVYIQPLPESPFFGHLHQVLVKPAKDGSALRIRFTPVESETEDEIDCRIDKTAGEDSAERITGKSSGRTYLEYAVPLPNFPSDHIDAGQRLLAVLKRYLPAAVGKGLFPIAPDI